VLIDQELQAAVGIARTYFEILWLVSEAPERSLRVSEIADRTDSTPSWITHANGRLERDGLVTRMHRADDHRGWYEVLTPAGQSSLGNASGPYAASIRDRLREPLGITDTQELRALGERILEHLGAEGDAVSKPDKEH
jgi:DNA-binding MarR family transcriptional regulator